MDNSPNVTMALAGASHATERFNKTASVCLSVRCLDDPATADKERKGA